MNSRLKASLTGLVLLIALTGCGTPPIQKSAATVLPMVDPATGVVSLPLDGYELTLAERGIFSTANDLAMFRCMKEAGYPEFFPFVDRRNPAPESNRRYGVWVRQEVARYGYHQPPPSAREKLMLSLNQLKMTPAADKAYQTCIPIVHGRGLKLPDPPDDSSRSGPEDSISVADSAQWKATRGEWIDCLKRNHAPIPAAGDWVPAGMLEVSLEVQIRVGLIDVACKQKLHTVQQFAELDAQAQQPYIEKHEAELVAKRRELDALVARSRAYIAGAPELPAS